MTTTPHHGPPPDSWPQQPAQQPGLPGPRAQQPGPPGSAPPQNGPPGHFGQPTGAWGASPYSSVAPAARPDEEKPWAAWTAQAMLAKKPKGWFRRNVWGLVLVLPMLAATVAVRWSDIYEDMWKSQPVYPISAAQAQWADFNGAQMRLVEFGQAANLVDRSNKPVSLPGGLKAWRAVVEFRAPDQDAMAGCKVTLEDAAGRQFGVNPVELNAARVTKSLSCTKDMDVGATPGTPSPTPGSSDYRATFFFITPGDAEPVAVRVMWSTRYPDFARLQVA